MYDRDSNVGDEGDITVGCHITTSILRHKVLITFDTVISLFGLYTWKKLKQFYIHEKLTQNFFVVLCITAKT